MKRLMFAAVCVAAVMTMSSCNGKSGKNEVPLGGSATAADSSVANAVQPAADMADTLAADGPSATAEDLWTEEAVTMQLKKYIDAVNVTFDENSGMSVYDLDKNFYTQYWNEVYHKVNEKDGKQPTTEKCFFIDDNHWTAGLEPPLEAEDVKVSLLTGDMAEARLTLKEKTGGLSQKVILSFDLENNQWRISNWSAPGREASESLLSQMEKYIR